MGAFGESLARGGRAQLLMRLPFRSGDFQHPPRVVPARGLGELDEFRHQSPPELEYLPPSVHERGWWRELGELRQRLLLERRVARHDPRDLLDAASVWFDRGDLDIEPL